MAAAAIPLITAAIPLLQPLISSLVVHVENLFGAKTGPTKFDAVLNAVTKVASDLSTAGKIPGQLDPNSIAMLIETVVQDLKSTGVLNPSTAAKIAQLPAMASPSNALPATIRIIGGSLTIGS